MLQHFGARALQAPSTALLFKHAQELMRWLYILGLFPVFSCMCFVSQRVRVPQTRGTRSQMLYLQRLLRPYAIPFGCSDHLGFGVVREARLRLKLVLLSSLARQSAQPQICLTVTVRATGAPDLAIQRIHVGEWYILG